MTTKHKLELAAVGGVLLLLVYAGWKVKSAVGGIGSAISDTAATGWQLVNVPVLDPSIPGASIGNAIVSAPANVLNTWSFGTVGGTTAPGASWLETAKAGPFGGLVGILTGDGNANIFGPAPAAGLDFGNGTGNW
ncbi:hypothetical protein [Caballeronia sp. LZ016]|uniref:hypothetical protein n=1 Tax=Caballeronia sp. LZ016 TaxID=3038554 RepID=UPI0028610CC7|nr:hypothetical protein [Caballeronia sp. LZ016]MDR5739488.1 hypothetical protein [Caballeronia sp. LZ016]